MILFVHRATYIRVIRLETMGARSENLGKIFRAGIIRRDDWIFDGSYRNAFAYNDTLNGSEKRQIIGLLDNLNGVRYRPHHAMRARWEEIIGLPQTA